MVEETLVKETLSNEMISAGASLVAGLDQIGVPVEAALWIYTPELGSWHLLIGSSDVPLKGPKTLYLQIRSILSAAVDGEPRVNIQDVFVVDRTTPLIAALSSVLGTSPGISGYRFSRSMANGMFITDSYIYRLSENNRTMNADRHYQEK